MAHRSSDSKRPVRFAKRRDHLVEHVEHEQAAFAARTFVVFLILAALFCLLIGRMVWLMVVKHDEFSTRSDENRIHTKTLAPPRGLIYDRNGRLLADNQAVFSVEVTVEYAGDLDATVAEVAALVDLSADEIDAFRARVASKRRPLQEIPLKLPISEQERAIIEVNRHRLHGIFVKPKTVRHYPYREAMAYAVGSVRRISEQDVQNLDTGRYQATRFIGKRGVEAFYEQSLHGKPGWQRVEVDARGRELGELSSQQPDAGQNITLHLDANLQIAASEALGDRRGAVVAIDPATGGILALVSKPGYDPNLFVAGIDPDQYAALANSRDTPLLDRATRGRYAPGSTFKPIVGLAGLSLGLTDWQRTVLDRGEFRLPNQSRAYRDWSWRPGNAGGQGACDLHRAIYRSSNVYFYELGSRMATDALPDFAAQFGYGRVTAIDVADADPGLLPDSEWKAGYKGESWYPGDTVNLSIGQGDLLATPLQLATVATVIANRGLLLPPRMLKSSDGPLAEFVPEPPRRVEGPTAEDWERLVDAMQDVVHRGDLGFQQNGTAWFYIGREIAYPMAGKSGTAQVVKIPQGQEYDEEELDERQRKHAWFIAFAPADAPRIAVSVLVENGGGGSSVAAPVVREVIDAYLLPRLAGNEEWAAAGNFRSVGAYAAP